MVEPTGSGVPINRTTFALVLSSSRPFKVSTIKEHGPPALNLMMFCHGSSRTGFDALLPTGMDQAGLSGSPCVGCFNVNLCFLPLNGGSDGAVNVISLIRSTTIYVSGSFSLAI